MTAELERYRKALEVAIKGLRSFSLDFAHEVEPIVKELEGILHPEPEYEEVEVSAGWVNIYDTGTGVSTSNLHGSKEIADVQFGSKDRLDCQEIKVKVKRPKPQPVERTAEVQLFADGSYNLWTDEEGYKTRVALTGKLTYTE